MFLKSFFFIVADGRTFITRSYIDLESSDTIFYCIQLIEVGIIISLTDITKYFDRNSKKRDLSANSNQEEGAKKLKEGSLNTSRASDIPDEVFIESLKSHDCVNILLSCIKNVERQITQIFENTKEMREGQIKGEKQLAELVKSYQFYI